MDANEIVIDAPKPVRAGEELDVAALSAFLATALGGEATVTVEQFPGGHSNLTYLVHRGDAEYVLRRPPFGSKVKSAHDMGREVSVLSKLGSYPLAPRVIAYEPTGAVLGAPFYVMERRRGVILRQKLPDSLAADHAALGRLCELLVDALVELHAVDYAAAGLSDLGKPVGYIERQVRGWSERYVGSKTDELPAMVEVAAWLAAHAPPDGAPALIHNDFKLDNLIFDPQLTRITGVLDWEMATIGDPLMDLGTTLSYDGRKSRRRPRRARVAVRSDRASRHVDARAGRGALPREVRPPDRAPRLLLRVRPVQDRRDRAADLLSLRAGPDQGHAVRGVHLRRARAPADQAQLAIGRGVISLGELRRTDRARRTTPLCRSARRSS